MMTAIYYKMRLRSPSRSVRWQQPTAFKPFATMPSASYSDIPSPCRRNHCPSQRVYCNQRSCRAALASRLDRREVTITTWRNTRNPVLDNIDLIRDDIRRYCDRSAWKGKEMTRASTRFATIMNCTLASPRCRCKTCAIERADRKIKLLAAQYSEAKRWLETLKKYRWQYDLDNISNIASVGR